MGQEPVTAAVILVGGEATRLRPLTENIPKAMVPVLNVPFLENVIRHLGEHRITDIILAQSHRAQSIQSYLGDGNRFGVRLSYAVEDTPLGTAGAVKNAAEDLNRAFLVLNGDTFTDLDVKAMIEFHQDRQAKATIAITPVDDPTSYGLVETDTRCKVTRFLEKPEPSQVTTNMVNAGTYVLEPQVLTQIPPETKVSIERETFPQLLSRGEPVFAYPSAAYWIDIGTPEKYLQLHRDLLGGKSGRYTLNPGEKMRVGENSRIDPTAEIKGAAMIGRNCSIEGGARLIGPVVIGDECTVGEGTVIDGSVIWRNVSLAQRVNLKDSIVADNCRLDSNSTIQSSVLGDSVTITSGYRLEPGSKIRPGTIIK